MLSRKRITRRWSDCADAQARLRLCFSQTTEARFSHVEAQVWALRGHMYTFLNNYVILSLSIILMFANKADIDEMQQYAAFHLALHCLPEYPFRGFRTPR